jgi:RNA polymerase sigma-70 factor, ECF subfamily
MPMNTGLEVFATQPQGDSEVHLVSRAQAGDEAAFAALFEKYKRSVYSLCLRMTRASADAEDLTQDVFLLLFRKISLFRGESAFSTWLYRLVVNAVLARLRKQGTKNVSLEQEIYPDGGQVQAGVGAPDPRLRHYLDRLNLERAIASLPPSYRAVFALYVVHGYEHSEIAKLMNCSVGNSKAQLHKARRKLRAWLLHDHRQRSTPAPAKRWARKPGVKAGSGFMPVATAPSPS